MICNLKWLKPLICSGGDCAEFDAPFLRLCQSCRPFCVTAGNIWREAPAWGWVVVMAEALFFLIVWLAYMHVQNSQL